MQNFKEKVRSNRVKIIGLLLLIGLATYGLFAAVQDAEAFFDREEWKAVEMVNPAKVSAIFNDADGEPNNGFEQQIVVGSVQPFYNADTDTFMLIITPLEEPPLSGAEE